VDDELKVGDLVVFLWAGAFEVHGIVDEFYGTGDRRHVVLLLSPEVSGYVVAEPTTLSLPIHDVHRALAA
jgi:hypothetical protein